MAVACCAAAICLPSIATSAELDAGDVRILRYEPFNPLVETATASRKSGATGDSQRLRFDAYGRRFDLTLEKNSRLTHLLPAGEASVQNLYRGKMASLPNSWVRLSVKGQTIRGMMWDGQDLYIVDSADAVRDPAAAPASASTDTIIFRLADTLMEEPAAFCGTDDSSADVQNGREAYESLVEELQDSPVMLQALGATLRIELSVLGDLRFAERYPSAQQARDEILLRLNNVDGIFSSQLGVEIQVPTLTISTATTDPFSATTVPSELLRELGLLRRQTPELRARGLTHLFTGRNLDGTTVGIAYRDTLCERDFGAGLTEASGRGSWVESLIAAHEIGHNFGAEHDGSGSCAATPVGQFLMSPSVNPAASTFSDCSIATITPRVQSASCIVPLPAADLSVPSNLGTVRNIVSTAFNWDLTITNVGGSSALSAQVELTVPSPVQVIDATVAGGSCTNSSGTVSCTLGDVAGSATRVVRLNLRSDVVGTNAISARVSSQNDAQTANDSGTGTLIIDPAGTTTPPPPTTPPVQSGGGGGGGGGSTGALLLLSLGGLILGRRRQLSR